MCADVYMYTCMCIPMCMQVYVHIYIHTMKVWCSSRWSVQRITVNRLFSFLGPQKCVLVVCRGKRLS